MADSAAALVATCMDSRVQPIVSDWIKQKKLSGKHIRVAVNGGVKNREVLMGQIRAAVANGSVNQVHLVNHDDCSAYAERNFATSALEREAHENDLKNTRAAIGAEFGELEVKAHFLTLGDRKVHAVE